MYVFIINPMSGKGAALSIWHEVELLLRTGNIPYETHICISTELTDIYMTTKIAAQSITAFVVIGGDGTVSSILQHLAETKIPLAVLPAGSGNDVARNFGLVVEPERFVSKLLDGKTLTLDLLYVNGIYGITVAGIGMDAKIGMRADRSNYKRLFNKINRGADAYTIAAIIELLTYKPFNGNLYIDGNLAMQSDLWLIASGNVKMYGGGLIICPYADPTDGLIDITLLHNAKRLKVLSKLFPALLKGKPVIAKEVTYLKGKEIIVEGDRLLPFVIDGEIFHSEKIQLFIRPKTLQLIATL